MRENKEKHRIFWFNIDGLNADIFYGLLDANRLPGFGMIFSRARRAEQAVGVFPTVNLTSRTSLATGAMPGRHLMTGNGWYDRYGKKTVYRDYKTLGSELEMFGYGKLGMPTLVMPRIRGEALANSDMSGGTATIFDAIKTRSVRSAVIFNQVSRGANEWVYPSRLDFIRHIRCRAGAGNYGALDRDAARRAIEYIKDTRYLHRLIQFNFPGLNELGRFRGMESQEKHLTETLDPIVSRLLEELSGLCSIGDCFFVLSASHGQAEVKPGAGYAVTPLVMRELLGSMGFELYDEHSSFEVRKASAVAFSQGGSYNIYIKNRDSRRWHTPPRLKADLVEIASDIERVSRKKFAGIQPGWIDMILIKDYDHERYLVLSGRKLYEPDVFFNIYENRKKYPDAVHRVRGLYCKRSADLILLSDCEKGFHFSSNSFRGCYGGLCEPASVVPLMFSGPGIKTDYIPGISSIIDVAPTVSALFDVSMTSAEGKILPIF
ncbi:MAG TPA: alkaline phosphatase family protein [bacterium]|nr:alkaline phosphatase family protein [bacterium]